MQTEYRLHAPAGLRRRREGAVHREGAMRLATARDEIEPLRDAGGAPERGVPRACCCWRASSRGIGDVSRTITPEVVEGLCTPPTSTTSSASTSGSTPTARRSGAVACPSCAHAFEVDLTEIEDGRLGE